MSKQFYVSMTDKFLSGWGGAKGKRAKYVIVCDTYQQAMIIEKNACFRPEMRYVNICSNMPRYKNAQVTFEHFDNLGDVWTKE